MLSINNLYLTREINWNGNYMITIYKSLFKACTLFLIYGILGINSALALTENFSLKSEILHETRRIVVHLPEGYDDKYKNGYSVIYMLDAGNDDVLTAKTAKQLNTAGILPKVIVVAIENIRRGYDFTRPYDMFGRGEERKKGNGDKFLAFIKMELIPKTNKKYRTNTRKIFMGHSAGGAFTSYLLSQLPDLFDGFLIFSPAPRNSEDRLFQDYRDNFNRGVELPEFVYVSVGGDEEPRFQESYKSLTAFLKKHTPSSVKLKFEITEGANHMGNPEKSISRALKFGWKTYASDD